jgi:hypothetical protein
VLNIEYLNAEHAKSAKSNAEETSLNTRQRPKLRRAFYQRATTPFGSLWIAEVLLPSNMLIKKLLLLFCFYSSCIICSSCTSSKLSAASVKNKNQDIFWDQLRSNCGKAFKGTVVEAPDTDTTFRGKELIIHIRSCEENRIRIPFMVGTNRSRTFVVTRFANKLEWKHDHRHEDGKPDAVTMYGGSTSNSGSANMQVFPADEQSIQINPAMIGNVWWVEIEPGKSLTYNLRRLGTNRLFSVKFDLTKPVEAPVAPWGWLE